MKNFLFLFCLLLSIMSASAQTRHSTKTEFVAGYYILDSNRLIKNLEGNVDEYVKNRVKGKYRDAFMKAYAVAVNQIAKGTISRNLQRSFIDSTGTLKNTPGKYDAMGNVANYINEIIDGMIKYEYYLEFSTE